MEKISKKWLLGLSIPVILGVSVLGISACHGHGIMTPERILQIIDWRMDDVLNDLNATADQREQITQIKDRLITDGISLHKQLHDSHGIFLNEWKSDSPDLTVIYSGIDDAAALKRSFARKVAAGMVDLHAILTPEQRSILTTRIEEHIADAHNFLKSN